MAEQRLDEQTVRRLAHVAGLPLDQAEVERLAPGLAVMLDHAEQLSDLGLDEVGPAFAFDPAAGSAPEGH